MKKTLLSLVAISALATGVSAHTTAEINYWKNHFMNEIHNNMNRPDQIQSGEVIDNGKTIKVTEKSLANNIKKITNIDVSGIKTDQGDQNALGVQHNASWADQIQSGEVQGSTLKIDESSKSGTSAKSTYIDMSGLVTNQGTQNANDIQSNTGLITAETTRAQNVETELAQGIQQNSEGLSELKNKVDTRNEHFRREVHNNERHIAQNKELIETHIQNDQDTDRTNELIQSINMNGNTLEIQEGTDDVSQTVSVDLSQFDQSQEVQNLDQRVSQNESDISTNATNISTNATNIAHNVTDISQNAVGIATNAGNILDNKIDIQNNRQDINTNTQNISSNEARISVNENNIQENQNEIKINTSRPDQIQSGEVQGSTLSITEESRTGETKTTDIDMSGLVTNQGTQNANDIQENREQISVNTEDIQTNSEDIQANREDIGTNQEHIAVNEDAIDANAQIIEHNAGGEVDGEVIRSNAQLSMQLDDQSDSVQDNTDAITINSQNIDRNWQSIQFNSQSIQNLDSRVTQNEADINNLYDLNQDLSEYAADVAAGSMAVSTIDFGTVHEGETEIGVGVGMSGGNQINTGTSFAGGVGIKYGIDDNTAAIAKGWASSNGNWGAGLGATWRF